MKVIYDTSTFAKDMKNITEYSLGFLNGIELGKEKFLSNLASGTIKYMKQFVDSMARVSPQVLHHVYEWNRVGSPESRLFDLKYSITDGGISINSTFRQSISIKSGSNVPFYDKARIMEFGIPVTIKPKKAKVLAFEVDGEEVFTERPVTVSDPGGPLVQGSLERTLDTFMNQYFRQSFLMSSGIMDKIRDTSDFSKNLPIGAKLGGSRGRQVGYSWIVKAGVIE